MASYDGLETLKPRRNLRPGLWAFYSVVQGLICKNLNNLLGNLNIYFSKDMNLDRNGSLSLARTQKNKIKLCKESKIEMDLLKIISLDHQFRQSQISNEDFKAPDHVICHTRIYNTNKPKIKMLRFFGFP